MNAMLGVAIFLLILWVVLKLILMVTGGFLHLLWIAAVVLFVLWLLGRLRGAG
ncbi:MAG: hypothetical protein ABI162_08390 [Luteolibacter sp.]